MGNCKSNSVGVLQSLEPLNKAALIGKNNLNIYISYCYFDKEHAQKLADDISKLKFNIYIDYNKTALSTFNTIDRSDIVIICISESYMKCMNCLREARYTFDKKVLPFMIITFDDQYEPDPWLIQIIYSNFNEQLRTNFKKFHYPTSKESVTNILLSTSSRILQDQEYNDLDYWRKTIPNHKMDKKKKIYEEKFKKQIEIEQLMVKKTKEHIEEVFRLNYDENIEEGNPKNTNHMLWELKKNVPGIYRWYLKYPNVTCSLFPPFTPTSDLNDALFDFHFYDPLQKKFSFFNVKSANKDDLSENETDISFQKESSKNKKIIMTEKKSKINLCILSSNIDNILASKKNDIPDQNHIFYMELIKRCYSFNTQLTGSAWAMIENKNFNSYPPLSEEDMKKRKLLDLDLNIMKDRRIKLSNYFNCPSDTFCKFAELMLKNKVEFEQFSKTYDSKSKLSKNYSKNKKL